MVHLGADTDPFAEFVVVVAGHMGHQLLARGQAQGVQKLRAPKSLADDLSLHRGIVIVHDVVSPQQHIALAVLKRAGQRAFGHIAQLTHRGTDQDVSVHFAQRGRGENAMANEIGDKAGGWAVIEAVGVVPLVQLAFVHDADHIADRKGFELVVCDEQGGGLGGFEDVAHLVGQALAQVDVQVGKRLVQQQQVGLGGQGSGQRHALLLTTREFVRVAFV